MELCVGAVSRLVIEEAAKLGVHQIVASRRQVNERGGYTGFNQWQLVEVVKDLSGGRTQVVRDHGGPYQLPSDDDGDWCVSFDADVAAGFDGLHIDVCKLPRDQQPGVLESLIRQYTGEVDIEIGGERDEQEWLDVLMQVALVHCAPTYVVLDVGGHISADRQQGAPKPIDWVTLQSERYHEYGVKTKAHNADWLGNRQRYADVLDAINIAPEYGAVEVDAWLHVLDFEHGKLLLDYAYQTQWWTRWFGENEGTWIDRAKCAVRYVMEDRYTQGILSQYRSAEPYVRERIADALRAG